MNVRAIQYSFINSTWVTAIWDWFMRFAGKAAEPVLFALVLYSGYQLVPGVPLPSASVQAIVFVIQIAALDIGGMGLIKLTKDSKPGEKKFAKAVGHILLILMIVTMVVATIIRVFNIPENVVLMVESILLIPRAVMSVLYGHAIHSLKDEKMDTLDQSVEMIVSAAVAAESRQLQTLYQTQLFDLKKQFEEVKSQALTPVKVEHFPELEQAQKVEPKVEEKVASERTTDPLKKLAETDPKVAIIRAQKVTKELDVSELKRYEDCQPKVARKSGGLGKKSSTKSSAKIPKLTQNVYTKSEAARLAKCSEFEIESALRSGTLIVSKFGGKILKSSLASFIVERKKLKEGA